MLPPSFTSRWCFSFCLENAHAAWLENPTDPCELVTQTTPPTHQRTTLSRGWHPAQRLPVTLLCREGQIQFPEQKNTVTMTHAVHDRRPRRDSKQHERQGSEKQPAKPKRSVRRKLQNEPFRASPGTALFFPCVVARFLQRTKKKEKGGRGKKKKKNAEWKKTEKKKE